MSIKKNQKKIYFHKIHNSVLEVKKLNLFSIILLYEFNEYISFFYVRQYYYIKLYL
jgi:hypothetical protein